MHQCEPQRSLSDTLITWNSIQTISSTFLNKYEYKIPLVRRPTEIQISPFQSLHDLFRYYFSFIQRYIMSVKQKVHLLKCSSWAKRPERGWLRMHRAVKFSSPSNPTHPQQKHIFLSDVYRQSYFRLPLGLIKSCMILKTSILKLTQL